ncbi:MAG: hypothetical protein FWD61_09410 [Phycisphaerales bacterium]|nr:hypothetical protein [Phycisphaerales bacterium]
MKKGLRIFIPCESEQKLIRLIERHAIDRGLIVGDRISRKALGNALAKTVMAMFLERVNQLQKKKLPRNRFIPVKD